jgi:hypothetical protein
LLTPNFPEGGTINSFRFPYALPYFGTVILWAKQC